MDYSQIGRHKVFISYYHYEDQVYKNQLLEWNQTYHLFEDYSVHENEIDDTGLTSEQIRRRIRDDYIKLSTVLILLCGQNTRKRKHIDWELHAAMYDSTESEKLGILVINLPTIREPQVATDNDEKVQIEPYGIWNPLTENRGDAEKTYPYFPSRLIDNIIRVNKVAIATIDWSLIVSNPQKIVFFVDCAFKKRKTNDYDFSAPLRRNNS